MTQPKRSILLILLLMTTAASSLAQNKNNVVYDSLRKQEVIVGLCDREFLEGFTPFNLHYADEYRGYQSGLNPSAETDSLTRDLFITIVLGTWCGDSREQVPRFLKVTDQLGFPPEHITLIGVDGRKQSTDPDVTPMAIEWVPTFIFTRNCKEIGRIIETPQKSLEEDFLEIIKGKKP
jgi:hypothetical protein